MKTNTTTLALAFMATLVLGCGGGAGPDDPTDTNTNTGVCTTSSGASPNCTAPTDTTTSTDTGTTTVTTTDTSTDTNTATNVTIPDWFKVGTYYSFSMINAGGSSYAEVEIIPSKINGDGTWTAKVNHCIGSCSGIGGSWTGTVSLSSFTVNQINATGVIPAAVSATNTHSSGSWTYNQSVGTYLL